MKKKIFRTVTLLILLLIIFEVRPFIRGALRNLSINTQVWNVPTAITSQDFGPVGLSGSQAHSVFFDFSDTVTITVFVGVRNPVTGAIIYKSPAGVGPFTDTDGVVAMSLPVAQFIKFNVAGTDVTGVLAFNES